MLDEFEKQGVTFHVEEGQVVANYEGEMPDELRQRILEHREQIRAAVLQREQQVKGFLSRVFLELRKKPVVYANGEAGLVAFCRAGCRGQVKEGCVYVLDEQELRSLSAADYTSWKFLTMSKAVFGGTLYGTSTVLDPRPDLKEDSSRWEAVLSEARKDPELHGLLHGLRCGGARLEQRPRGSLRLNYNPLLKAWQRKELLSNWLEPNRDKIQAVFEAAAERVKSNEEDSASDSRTELLGDML